jgi:hypothetical protein
MNIEEFNAHAHAIQNFANIGADLIKNLNASIKIQFSEHILIEKSTPHSLFVSFYGLRLVFRIEIRWQARELSAQIAAYKLHQDSSTESLIKAFPFDSMGNVNTIYTPKEFSAPLLLQVFNHENAAGITLTPSAPAKSVIALV